MVFLYDPRSGVIASLHVQVYASVTFRELTTQDLVKMVDGMALMLGRWQRRQKMQLIGLTASQVLSDAPPKPRHSK